MEPYKVHANGDLEIAFELFEWNTEISLQIWEIVYFLEVALKNTLDKQLTRYAVRESYKLSWIHDEKDVLKSGQGDKGVYGSLKKTLDRLKSKNIPITQDSVVAGLGLEFSVNLVSKRYLVLWPTLLLGFPNLPQRSQVNVHEPLQDLLNIRNRIAHHDKLWRLNIEYFLESFCNIAAYMDWEFYDLIQSKVYAAQSNYDNASIRFEF
jgi:hypothetical protein